MSPNIQDSRESMFSSVSQRSALHTRDTRCRYSEPAGGGLLVLRSLHTLSNYRELRSRPRSTNGNLTPSQLAHIAELTVRQVLLFLGHLITNTSSTSYGGGVLFARMSGRSRSGLDRRSSRSGGLQLEQQTP